MAQQTDSLGMTMRGRCTPICLSSVTRKESCTSAMLEFLFVGARIPLSGSRTVRRAAVHGYVRSLEDRMTLTVLQTGRRQSTTQSVCSTDLPCVLEKQRETFPNLALIGSR